MIQKFINETRARERVQERNQQSPAAKTKAPVKAKAPVTKEWVAKAPVTKAPAAKAPAAAEQHPRMFDGPSMAFSDTQSVSSVGGCSNAEVSASPLPPAVFQSPTQAQLGPHGVPPYAPQGSAPAMAPSQCPPMMMVPGPGGMMPPQHGNMMPPNPGMMPPQHGGMAQQGYVTMNMGQRPFIIASPMVGSAPATQSQQQILWNQRAARMQQ